MKNKIIFAVVFIIIVSAGIFSMVFLTKRGSSVAPSATVSLEEKIEAPVAEPKKEIPQYITVDTDYFALTLASNWEMTSEENTLPIIVSDSKEEVLNEKAKEIDFRTNLSINRAELGENSLKDYFEKLKTSLINTIPIIEITKEEEAEVSDREAYFMNIKSIQDDLKFNTFIVLIAGKENTVWAFSFNTLEESRLRYEDVFNGIIKDLQMK